MCLALAVTSWVGFCRITRGETFKLRELDYVHAARLMGLSEPKIIIRHILPNLMHLVLITFVLLFSGLVISEAILSWLLIGADGSWGQMIAQAKDDLAREPALGLEEVVLGVVEAVAVVVPDLRDDLAFGRGHQDSPPTGSGAKASYPSASSCSASSGPPSRTIRPSTNTCTKSGVT